MQCPSCLKNFAATLSVCPSCGAMPSRHDLQAEAMTAFCPLPARRANSTGVVAMAAAATRRDAAATVLENGAEIRAELKKTMKREFTSTLIEFPKRNEWRDEVRERVREARERRTVGGSGSAPDETEKVKSKRAASKREAAKTQTQNDSSASSSSGGGGSNAPATVINLKPNLEERPSNRLVARALERVERSRQVHDGNSPAAFATALAPAFQPAEAEEFADSDLQSSAPTEQPVARPFSVVSNPNESAETVQKTAPQKIETPAFDDVPSFDVSGETVTDFTTETELRTFDVANSAFEAATIEPKKQPRKIPVASEADLDSIIESQLPRISGATPARKPSPRSGSSIVEQEIAPRERASETEEIVEDYAPLGVRFAAGLLDAVVCVAGTAVLFAIFAPTGFFASEKFGLASFLTIVSVFAALKFFYLTATLTLAETTPAGLLFSLRVVHAEDGSAPTVFESAVNTAVYLLSLATAGVGFVPIFFSTEKRALHDLASGTLVIREK